MKVQRLSMWENMLPTNCYIVELENNEAVAIDISGEPEKVLTYLKENNLTLRKILLTHGHFDHIIGVEKVCKETGAEVFIHKLDSLKLTDIDENLGSDFGLLDFEPIEKFTEVSDGDVIKQGNTEFKVLHTPGHTMGGVCYIVEDVIFSGDTLFKLSIGRTDFPDSNWVMMAESLKKLKSLDGDYRVYPGHNFETELDKERTNNPYMRQM